PTATAALLPDARARAAVVAAKPAREVPLGITGAHDEYQAKDLLRRLGIATAAGRACQTRAEAHAALSELDGPVAVKLLDATVLHKTEIGGVHLGIAGAAELD